MISTWSFDKPIARIKELYMHCRFYLNIAGNYGRDIAETA
jgi:hypothetical protein